MTITVDQTGKRVIPNVAIETSLIVEQFKGKAPGAAATWKELSDLIGRDARTSGMGYLQTARRILLREYGILLETVRGEGVRIADDAGKLSASSRDMGSARRALGRASRKLEAVEPSKLTDDQRKEFHARTSVLGALRLLATPHAVGRVVKIAEGQTLPPAAVLGIFK